MREQETFNSVRDLIHQNLHDPSSSWNSPYFRRLRHLDVNATKFIHRRRVAMRHRTENEIQIEYIEYYVLSYVSSRVRYPNGFGAYVLVFGLCCMCVFRCVCLCECVECDAYERIFILLRCYDSIGPSLLRIHTQ